MLLRDEGMEPPAGGGAATYCTSLSQLLWIAAPDGRRDGSHDHKECRERATCWSAGAQTLGHRSVPDRLRCAPRGGAGGRSSGAQPWIGATRREPDVPSLGRIPVGRGIELHVEAAHPLADRPAERVAEAVRRRSRNHASRRP